MHFLAETTAMNTALGSGTGFNIWQSLGGLALVFGLLIVSLKFLGRLNKKHGSGESSLLAVWHLGPKREIQVLRLGQEVHYIYRHEGAMVLLKQESLQEWESQRAAQSPEVKPEGLASLLKNHMPRLSLGSSGKSSSLKKPIRVGDALS